MDMRGYQRYREDSLNTMTQGELLLLLYDELIKRLTQAELSLGQENYEVFEGSVGRSANLSRLYEYFCYELSRVVSGRNAKELARVKEMASELRDSFRQAEKSASTPPQEGV